jgi:hypothetical protein
MSPLYPKVNYWKKALTFKIGYDTLLLAFIGVLLSVKKAKDHILFEKRSGKK